MMGLLVFIIVLLQFPRKRAAATPRREDYDSLRLSEKCLFRDLPRSSLDQTNRVPGLEPGDPADRRVVGLFSFR